MQTGMVCCCMQAVAQGKWLVIEDLNLAPPEVLAALVPVLANRQLHLPQRAQVIKAAPAFQLLASITTAPGRLREAHAEIKYAHTKGWIFRALQRQQVHGLCCC